MFLSDFYHVGNPYIDCAMPDLMRMFCSLDNAHLERFLAIYKQKYGVNAYRYAKRTYPLWIHGGMLISQQTLWRLIDVLPRALETTQRNIILDKMIKFSVSNERNKLRYGEKANWENYNSLLFRLKTRLTNKRNSVRQENFAELHADVMEAASWLYNDDMIVAKKILNDYYFRVRSARYSMANFELGRFAHKCQELVSLGRVNDVVSLELITPDEIITIEISPREKTWFEKISSFLGGG